MTQAKSAAAKAFQKPAHWSNDPAPAPKAVGVDAKPSPHRHGHRAQDGIAVDC